MRSGARVDSTRGPCRRLPCISRNTASSGKRASNASTTTSKLSKTRTRNMSGKNKLVITTPSDLEIEMTRDFDAPRALVWEMFTKPEHVRQWWGYGHAAMIHCEIDLRVGGKYRFVGKTPDGREVPFCGEHLEIVYPEKIVFTEIFDVDMAREHPGVVTPIFTERDGKTTMGLVAKYDTKQTRDFVLQSGMEKGAAAGYDRIERLLAERTRAA